VNELLAAGVAAAQVGIITPYAAQARLLGELLPHPDLEIDAAIEIDTVDGFQGREKEAIVISFVRSNERGEIGFLSDLRRTNVAMTRARRKLTLIGDSATLSAEPFYARLIAHCESQGAYRTVWEEE
jgi:superfamily I DNA and/or RNA helicase